MTKNVAMILLVGTFCFAISGSGQENCELNLAELNPLVPGFEGKDTITLSDMLNAGKLVTKLKGLEVVSFHMAVQKP